MTRSGPPRALVRGLGFEFGMGGSSPAQLKVFSRLTIVLCSPCLGVSENLGTLFWVLITRILLFRVLYYGPLLETPMYLYGRE